MVFLTDFQCPQTGHLGVPGDKEMIRCFKSVLHLVPT